MELVRNFYRAIETGNEALLRATLSPDWEEIPVVYPGQPRGADGYLPIAQGFQKAFPDGRFEIHEIIDAAPKFTVRTTVHGTHQGDFLGLPGSGNVVAFNTIDVHEVSNGVIVRSWHIEDFATALSQMKG